MNGYIEKLFYQFGRVKGLVGLSLVQGWLAWGAIMTQYNESLWIVSHIILVQLVDKNTNYIALEAKYHW